MEKDEFISIMNNLESYKYRSLEYTEFDMMSGYEVICNNNQVILLSKCCAGTKSCEFSWAANDVSILLEEINKSNKNGCINFIPREWVSEFEKNKFYVFSAWHDYFNDDISKSFEPAEPLEMLEECDCKEASEVTNSCRWQSRGFTGETEEWIIQWINGAEPSHKDSAVLIHREDAHIAGVLFITIYGHGHTKGPMLWVRLLAVRPEYQRRGIGRKLLGQALFYGKCHGAKRAFLGVDECNEHAIKLYESMGFIRSKDESEINMIRK